MTTPVQPETNPPPATVTTAPPTPPEPARTPVVVAPQPQSPAIGDAMTQLASHVASLPERIVDALRESTPKPPETPVGNTPANPATAPPATLPAVKTTKARFHDFWFGK